jgi:hypothetical protein
MLDAVNWIRLAVKKIKAETVKKLWGRYRWCEYLPHINSCLWIYTLNTMKISRTELVANWTQWSPTARGVASVVAEKPELPLAVATAVRLVLLHGELELASVGESRVASVMMMMMPSPVAPQTAASHTLPVHGAWALRGPKLVRTKGSPVARSNTAMWQFLTKCFAKSGFGESDVADNLEEASENIATISNLC